VFGFYPFKGLPTLFDRNVKSIVKDNSGRDYDVQISRSLSADEFNTVLQKSIAYAQHSYHLNKYNCYDYAVLIYNSIAGQDTVPLTTVKYPFIFGRGGSPVSIYNDLKMMQRAGTPGIEYGHFIAPISTGRKKSLARK
jgi:hypothetical protein